MTDSLSFTLADSALAGLYVPIVALAIAALAGMTVWLFASLSGYDPQSPQPSVNDARSQVRTRYRVEQNVVALTAIAIALAFAVELLLRGYVFPDSERIAWWRAATPLIVGAVGLSILLVLVLTRGTRPSVEFVGPTVRRTWSTFSRTSALVGGLIAVAALALTTIAAGSASWTDDRGRSAWLEIPVPNEAQIDPIRVPFYGWSFGVPVLIALTFVLALSLLALRSNAVRPFIRPETLAAERIARRGLAAGITHIVTASALLALAGAWRMIAQASTVSSLVIVGQNDVPFDAAWRYAELGTIAGWCAPVLEVTAFALLALAAQVRRPWATTASRRVTHVTTPIPAS